MLTRRFYNDEDLLKLFNEEAEEDMEDEGGDEEASVEELDIDLESMSSKEKLKLAHEILSSIEDIDCSDAIECIEDCMEEESEEEEEGEEE